MSVSDAKIRANRANARASTGPKTAQGRARSSRNALRHALSLPVYSDPALSRRVHMLGRKIIGTGANPGIQELARRTAVAEIDLRRVRYARHQLLILALSDRHYEARASMCQKVRALCSLLQPNAPEIPAEYLVKIVSSTPEGPLKLATIISQEKNRLLALDRYERRAISRRKFAIRLLDEARATALRVTSATERQ